MSAVMNDNEPSPSARNAPLDEVETFLGRFVSYPSEHARVAHVLWIMHTHFMDAWESTPRIAFLSPEPASGKSRALEVSALLVPRPVVAVNVSPNYLFRKVSDSAGRPTILYDEIDTVFGPKARGNEDIRGLLNAGHRRNAVAGRCVVRDRKVSTEELPAYCAVALAGLGDLPDTILTRSVIVRMRRRRLTEPVEPFRQRVHEAEGHRLRERIEQWAVSAVSLVSVLPDVPAEIEDRDADLWEPLVAVADAAGGRWPERARVAGVTLVSLAKGTTPSLSVRLLSDLHRVFGGREKMFTRDIIKELCALEDSPWRNLKGEAIDDRGIASRLRPYEIEPKTIRVGMETAKGYERTAFYDAWARYLPSLARETSVTPDTDAIEARREGGEKPTLVESQP